MQSDILMLVFILGIFVVIIGTSFYLQAKRKAASWSGTVIDKAITENVQRNSQADRNPSGISFGSNGIVFGNNQTNITHHYNITVRSATNNKEFNWPISSGFYETVQIGDKLVKQSGSSLPEITEKAPAQSASASPAMPDDTPSNPLVPPVA